MGQGMATCVPDGSSCTRESEERSRAAFGDQKPQQDWRQSIVVHIVVNRIDHSQRRVCRALQFVIDGRSDKNMSQAGRNTSHPSPN